MSVLNQTPRSRLADEEGRPYFLWDMEMTLARFEDLLRTGSEATRGYLLAKLMREARPDDVFLFVTVSDMRRLWPHLERHLGRARPFWSWLLEVWSP